jgi:C4-type Zn-finger protein
MLREKEEKEEACEQDVIWETDHFLWSFDGHCPNCGSRAHFTGVYLNVRYEGAVLARCKVCTTLCYYTWPLVLD